MPVEFISVSEAKELIADHIKTLPAIKIPLNDAAGLVLAEDIFSITDIPPFNQSSMDGYAFDFTDFQKNSILKIDGMAQAGSGESSPLLPGHARRIFTGAAVPTGADTVVMQEKVQALNGQLTIQDSNLLKGLNVRPRGAEARSGELAMKKNSILSAAAIGFIAGIGVHELMAYPKPSVSIILTGNELQQPGKPLIYGQVYESNSFALSAALRHEGIINIDILYSEDDLGTLSRILADALDQSDLILLTGGVSVGDYDFVIRAAQANGIEQIFHKIRQKPGKPLYFGQKGQKYIFGLPGNPASVLTCFYKYVYPALGLLSAKESSLKQVRVPLNASLRKSAGLTHFLKGFYDGETVKGLKAQESFRLSSFAHANCLIQLDEEKTEFKENDIVEVHLLPQ